MFRNFVLALILGLPVLACAPQGGFGPWAAAQCRDELAMHCTEVCNVQGSLAVGYISIYPFHELRCVCKPPEEKETTGFAF